MPSLPPHSPFFFTAFRGLQSTGTWAWKSSMSCRAPCKLQGLNMVWNLGFRGSRSRVELRAKLPSSFCKHQRELGVQGTEHTAQNALKVLMWGITNPGIEDLLEGWGGPCTENCGFAIPGRVQGWVGCTWSTLGKVSLPMALREF